MRIKLLLLTQSRAVSAQTELSGSQLAPTRRGAGKRVSDMPFVSPSRARISINALAAG